MRKDLLEILDRPAPKSLTHPHMSGNDRAAQFSPFAALNGYEDVIIETGRETQTKRFASADKAEEIAKRLQILDAFIETHPYIRVRYFLKDAKKEGGSYLEYEGSLRHIDPYERRLEFCDGAKIPLRDIDEIEGDLFEERFE